MARVAKHENSNLKLIFRSNVTGLSYHDYALVAKQIQVGDEVELEHRENNLHDQEAIAVLFNGTQIGWLSNDQTMRAAKGVIWRMLKNNIEIRAKVISHDTSVGDLSKRMYIGLYIRIV